MSGKTRAVLNLVEAWARRDIDFMMAQFADDAIFENVPMELIVGKDDIRAANQAFMAMYREAPWEIHHIVEAPDGTVLTERSDIFILNDGRRTECRVMGAITVNDDNLIVHWRDYFDLADWNRQLGADPDFGRKGYRQTEAATTTAGE